LETVLGRAHSWIDAHPLAGDGALAALVLLLSLGTFTSDRYPATTGALVLSVLLCAPLVLRRRAPLAVFAAVMLGCAAELLIVDQFLAATGAALIALYTLVAYAPRKLAAIGYAVTLAGAVPFALRSGYFTSDSAIVTWLVLAAHLTLAAALGDRRHARLRALEQETALAAAAERTWITRELHDVVAHSLSVVIAQADGGRYAPGQAETALTTIAATAREALAEMRRALGVLREEPDTPDIKTLVARTRAAGLPVELAEEGSPRPLAPGTGLAVYRVAQEALTNVLKHAGPGASAHVTLRWEPERVTVVVRDDGAGAGTDDGRGRGLAGMRERVEPRGGTVSAGPRPEGGFEVRAAIPAKPRPAGSFRWEYSPGGRNSRASWNRRRG
jgi:signal transduction histidine kinase